MDSRVTEFHCIMPVENLGSMADQTVAAKLSAMTPDLPLFVNPVLFFR